MNPVSGRLGYTGQETKRTETPVLNRTVLFILITLVLLLLVGRFGDWRPVGSPHVAARWKEVSFTRIKPAVRQDDQKNAGTVSSIKVLKPDSADADPAAESTNQP
jgi:hypothetical protein